MKNTALNTEVVIFLEGTTGPITGVLFISYDPTTDCATFSLPGGPGIPGPGPGLGPTPTANTLVVDCKKIAALLYH
ncbi:hypothetical protein J2Z23_000030 [Lederbergia galactosidilyticus]|uniref:hypothetical protein n=1 Tax=Lederbergia galactosidilytica TaxID=217031 RepID=UPI001AE199F9|nr:hypothetical protein [Lederbergia galactosidilytica]MBP1913098.1 hypothetical protein [Lederbergia galactosidilytica]